MTDYKEQKKFKDKFLGCAIPDWQLSLSRTWSWSFYFLAVCDVSAEKNAVNLMSIYLQMIWSFLLFVLRVI